MPPKSCGPARQLSLPLYCRRDVVAPRSCAPAARPPLYRRGLSVPPPGSRPAPAARLLLYRIPNPKGRLTRSRREVEKQSLAAGPALQGIMGMCSTRKLSWRLSIATDLSGTTMTSTGQMMSAPVCGACTQRGRSER